jgi:FKBP-type peptidyl-prolyl cis-trans isomerase 2
MVNIKKGDFIEVEYTGKVVEDNFVFDTTSEKVAKEMHIHNPYAQYGPSVVCIGQQQLLKGLDEGLVGKEIGKEYTIKLSPEQAFGKKSAELLRLVPLSAFKKGNTRPEIGMQVDVDGQMGIVKTVTGGRVIVDFNHPLSSKELEYKIKINKIVTDDVEKVTSTLALTLNLKKDKIDVKIHNGKATVTMIKLPEVFHKELAKRITEVVPTIKEVVFEEKKEEKAEKQPLNRSKQ